MGRALMIPGIVGKNTELWLQNNKTDDMPIPKNVAKYGSTKEEIFVCYEEVKDKYGKDVDKMPLGAIGIYSVAEKIRIGLQQLMAGSRKWKIDFIKRDNLMSLTPECAKVTGIPYVMDAYRDEALKIIDGK
jgi:hypothetical protein